MLALKLNFDDQKRWKEQAVRDIMARKAVEFPHWNTTTRHSYECGLRAGFDEAVGLLVLQGIVRTENGYDWKAAEAEGKPCGRST